MIRPLNAKKIQSDLWTQKENLTDDDVTKKNRTRENKDVMNECFWIVSLIVLEVSPGGPLDVPSRISENPPDGLGLAGARNRQILNRTSIEKYTDFDGRRIREFCPSRTRPDLVLFRALGGIDSSRAAPRSRPVSSAASASQSSPQALPCTRALWLSARAPPAPAARR